MGEGVKTNGVGKRTTAHLNLTVSLADVGKRKKVMALTPAFDNRFAANQRPKVQP